MLPSHASQPPSSSSDSFFLLARHEREDMAPSSLNPNTHHLPYRTTTTILLEDPPYLSLSGNDDVDGDAGAGSLCKGHGENVRCDHCTGGREDGIVINEIGGGGGGVMAFEIRESDDEICDSDDDSDEDGDGEEVVGRGSPASPCSSSSSPMALMPTDIAVAKTGWMVLQHSPPLTPIVTVVPSFRRDSLQDWMRNASAGMESEDSAMPDSCVDAEGCDSGYESANGDGGDCQLADSDANPGKHYCESPVSDVGEGDDYDYEALYQQLKGPNDGISGGWQGWVTPQSSCGELSSPCESDEKMVENMTGHLGKVMTAQREARGRMKRSGEKTLTRGGQKMRKMRKGGDGRKQALRKRCVVGHAGVPWVS